MNQKEVEKSWFTVSKEGLKQLQKGKAKTFVISELSQNAFDEDITTCKINITRKGNKSRVSVEDDNPIGFRDITHSYTLFADTYKRRNPEKRGRFNLGEKQVIAICDFAKVKTTKGTVLFDENGRTELPDKTEKGSIITVEFETTPKEHEELIKHTEKLIQPDNIKFIVNGKEMPKKKVFKQYTTSLDTEILKDGQMVPQFRKTKVNLLEHNGQPSYIYEMGIPIVEIDTPWHVDVQQKIPLGVDRETVRPAFIQDVYAETLNVTHDIITTEQSSEIWVRTASKDKRVQKQTLKSILQKRFGDKFLSRNPFDRNANQDAIAGGYNVINGSELSKEEWQRIRELNLIKSTTEKFGHKGLEEQVGEPIEEGTDLDRWRNFCRKCAKEFQGNDINVKYVKCTGTPVRADYGGHELRFNLNLLPKRFFKRITEENIDLLIHELAHERGNHAEENYYREITRLAGAFTIKAIKKPDFFELEEN